MSNRHVTVKENISCWHEIDKTMMRVVVVGHGSNITIFFLADAAVTA
jgi:hypothetical protein